MTYAETVPSWFLFNLKVVQLTGYRSASQRNTKNTKGEEQTKSFLE